MQVAHSVSPNTLAEDHGALANDSTQASDVPQEAIIDDLNQGKPSQEPAPVLSTPDARPTYKHLRGKAIEALTLSKEERIAFACTDRWIGYPAAGEAMKYMQDLLAMPRKSSMPGVMLLGRPGNGKSTILHRLAEQNPSTVTSEGSVHAPIIFVELSAGANESVFWTDVLHGCGVAHRVTDHFLRKRTQAFSLFNILQPRAIQFDEFHHILLGPPNDQRKLLAVIKNLSNILRVPIMVTGIEDAIRLVDTDDQLKRRLKPFALPVWRLNDDFRRLLSSFEMILPLASSSGLAGPEMSARLHDMADGTIGSLANILQEAARLAIETGQESIDLKILDKVKPNTVEERLRQFKKL